MSKYCGFWFFMRCQNSGSMSLGKNKNVFNLDENFKKAREHSYWSPKKFLDPKSVNCPRLERQKEMAKNA